MDDHFKKMEHVLDDDFYGEIVWDVSKSLGVLQRWEMNIS